MTLKRYREKRDFSRTSEPSGKEHVACGQRFVVQQHAARRMHYDVRLELDGVLKSWAVPKGPSLNPADKRLAVQTEDHPVSYATFEGVIPKGAYGAGRMIVWDEGTWAATHNPRSALTKGHLVFTLYGHKLRGSWHLLRTGDKPSNQWLLIKGDDAHARSEGSIAVEQPLSIYSHRRITDVDGQLHNGAKTSSLGTSPPQPKPLPSDLTLQLATAASAPPSGSGWLYEIKLDGYRLMATRCGTEVRLLTRSGNDWSLRLPAITAAIAALPYHRLVLDGELVASTDDGSSSFSSLQDALAQPSPSGLTFCVFDLLLLGEHDMRLQPLKQRKEALAGVLTRAPVADELRFWPHASGRSAGLRAWAAASAQGLEGIVAKRADALYEGGRSPDWQKIKCVLTQEFVVVGYCVSAGSAALRSLLLGHYTRPGRLTYVGRVASGISRAQAALIGPALYAARGKSAPLHEQPAIEGAIWVKPLLVVVVRFAQWTPQGRLRHATLIGLREDKHPQDVYGEVATPKRLGQSHLTQPQATVLTHPNRRVVPKSQVTKAELAAYMQAAAQYLLPYVHHRPLSVLRCPKADLKHNFFHKHLSHGLPGIGEVLIDNKPYACLNDPAGLQALVQLSVIELHIWGSRAPHIESPDTIVFDLDPDVNLPVGQTIAAAQTLRRVLRELGLTCLLKATGGKGLHVVVPGITGCSWAETKGFSHMVAHYVVAKSPSLYTAVMSKRARRGKVFIDFYRNGRGSTSIAPFSPRALPSLPIARPLAWNDLADNVLLHPWTVADTVKLLTSGFRDPWRQKRRLAQKLHPDVVAAATAHTASLSR